VKVAAPPRGRDHAQSGRAPAAPEAAADPDAAKTDDTQLDEPDVEGNRPIRWAKLSDQVTESVYTQITKLGIRGVYGSRVYRRDYPHNEMAAHIIGYVDREERPDGGHGALRRLLPEGRERLA
jgi:cell division protein FtsI/penicillin-binding protein 2